ncbi:hypothetical protein PHMEG_00034547 [Phytophthora megakarya]|uniref:Uncharacterized protein n=1 Tax=Phytophthora megakarya TaxID=4795 RepID=A0A225UQR8_9STRA|nr:hypothetical protein PHMEG_00034547 [Phytophthora megakarya]
MTFAPSSTHAVHQSAGFPDYVPNKAGGIQPLKQRFILADVQALLATEPWTTMFENRVKRLALHSYGALTPRARMALDKYIRFMEENASGFWHGGHWFAIDTSTQGGADMQTTMGCSGSDRGNQTKGMRCRRSALHDFLGGSLLVFAIQALFLDSHEPQID